MKKTLAIFAAVLFAVAFAAADVVQVKTANYSIDVTDNGTTILMNSTSARIFYLPSLEASSIGFSVTLVKVNSGNVTVQAPGADYIANSGVGQYVRNTTAGETYASVTLVLGSLNHWYVRAASGTWATDTSGLSYALTGTPTYTSVTVSGGTASTALTLNASKAITSSSTTDTELGYVHNVTSAIQTQIDAKAPAASPSFTGTVTLPTSLTGYVKASSGTVSAGSIADADLPSTIKGASIYNASNAALAADGVLTTTIPAGVVGIVMIKEATALNQYFLMTPTAVGGALMTNAAYTATKDNSSTINVYVDSGVVKVQNKTAGAINVKIGLVGFN